MDDARRAAHLSKPPLCKGRWHGEAVTEGLIRCAAPTREMCYVAFSDSNPSVSLAADSSLYTREPKSSAHLCALRFERKIPRPEPRDFLHWNYSLIAITTPEPTVRPPSRIAKRRPTSIAMGVISSTFISTLSPGMHISTPSGRLMTPVTSVVRK